MRSDRVFRLEQCKANIQSYATARKPTAEQAQRVAASVSELLSADFGERVMVTIGSVVIARSVPIAAN